MGKLHKDHPERVSLRYGERVVVYKILRCEEIKKGVFCEVEKDGKRLTGVHLDSLMKSRFKI